MLPFVEYNGQPFTPLFGGKLIDHLPRQFVLSARLGNRPFPAQYFQHHPALELA